MNILIIGCGFLGSRAGSLLVERGERVWGTVRSSESGDRVRRIGIEPLVADVLDPESLEKLPQVDRILYCVGFDRSAGISMRRVYVDGLRGVIERVGGSIEKLVYVSSTGVFGQDDGGWVNEQSPTEPRHEAGKVCLEAEQVFAEVNRTCNHVILRYAGLYGPNRVIRRTNLEKREPIVGDPGKWLNVVHIDDAAGAALAALDGARNGSLYLVCDDRPVTRKEYYELAAEILGVDPPTFNPPAPGSLEASRDESNKRICNQCIKQELGWIPKHKDITTGLRDALLGAV